LATVAATHARAYNGFMSVADALRRELKQAQAALTPDERVRLALKLGERDLGIFMQASGLGEPAARLELARRRQAGRRPSKSASR
jgi:hypothetical protein